MDYENIIIKTALKTILVLLLSISILFFATGLIAPGVIGDFTYRLGLTSISVPYTKAQYEYSKDINDLATLIDRAYQMDDYQTVVDYADDMYAHEHYLDYVNYESTQNDINYTQYLSGIYVISLLEIGDSDTATDIVISNTKIEDDKYTNVIKYLVVAIDKYQPSIEKRSDMYEFINLHRINMLDTGNLSLIADYELDYQVIFNNLRGDCE